MADEIKDTVPEKPKSKSGLKPILIVGIGCFVLLFIAGTALALAGRFLAKRVGVSLFQSLIEKNTGVKTNLSEIEKGKLSLTDKTSGTKLDVGTGKLPDNFPKDFPLYPGAKVAMSGNESGQQLGFWLTLTTTDPSDQVSGWYKTNLKSAGWEVTFTLEKDQNTTWSVTKGTWEGTVSVSGSQGAKETTISVVLGEGQKQIPTETAEPAATSETGVPTPESTDQGSM